MSAMTLRVGGRYNWRNQPERLIYIGTKQYPGDSRTWHQFKRITDTHILSGVCCEVLDSDLPHFEESQGEQA